MAMSCSCSALQRCFSQCFKGQAGQSGMLRQLAGPLRQMKKGELFTFLLHAQTEPLISHSHTHTHSPFTQMTESCVCVCGLPASRVLSFQACFDQRRGKVTKLLTQTPLIIINGSNVG